MILVIALLIGIFVLIMCNRQIFNGGDDHHNYTLLTSNENKIREYRSLAPEIKAEKGPDIREVKGTTEEVIIYKTLDILKDKEWNDILVEDTSLDVEGEDVGINVRYVMDDLLSGDEKWIDKRAVWRVLIGLGTADENGRRKICIAEGIIDGKLVYPRGEGFGFDPIFQPDGSDKTLAELGDDKSQYSARLIAIKHLLDGDFIKVVYADEVPQWTGEYQ